MGRRKRILKMLQQSNRFAMKRLFGPIPNYPKVLNYKHPHDRFTVIAGPCSVEGEEHIFNLAKKAFEGGATHLRGGIFKAGTFPGEKFGMTDRNLLKAHHNAAQQYGLKNIIEVLDYSQYVMDLIDANADCFQVGCRQMQNYNLLRTLGLYNKPVFLKRHPGSTMDEFLGAAEHLLVGGVKELYLIERGSSSHLNHVRWDLSISIIPAIKQITNVPVIVDGSHGTGRRDLVSPMTLAGVAAGAKGILVEIHEEPDKSASDPDQALTPTEFHELMLKVDSIRQIVR